MGRPDLGADHADRRGARYSEQLERFIIGGSRVIYALAESGMIPKVFASMHPRYQTPHVAILSIGVLCFFAPLFGREILVWLANAGSFRHCHCLPFCCRLFHSAAVKAPEQSRPFRVPSGYH